MESCTKVDPQHKNEAIGRLREILERAGHFHRHRAFEDFNGTVPDAAFNFRIEDVLEHLRDAHLSYEGKVQPLGDIPENAQHLLITALLCGAVGATQGSKDGRGSSLCGQPSILSSRLRTASLG